MRNGQSPLISHTTMLIFTVILVAIVIASLNVIKDNYQLSHGMEEIKQICNIVRGGIEKIYLPESYISPTDSRLGEITLDLPNHVLDLNYKMKFVNDSLYIETEIMNLTCKLGFDVSYNGSSSGRTKITWIRLSNGTDVINMERI